MTTRKSNLTLTNLAAKKLLGKAHTSNIKDVSNEPYPSNVSVVSEGVFGEPIPNAPGSDFYTLYSASVGEPATVEKIYFDVVSDSSKIYDADSASNAGPGDESSESGPHGYYLKLTSNYQTTSSNPNKGSGAFLNDARLYNSRGALQIVPPFISTENPNPYQLKLYNASNQEISFTDNSDWTVDYYAGTIFIQDYVSQVGGISKVPVSASAYLYVGQYLDDKINSISSSAGGNVQVLNDGNSLTTAVTSINFTGSGIVATGGAAVTVTVADAGGISYSRRAVTSTITASTDDTILGVSASAALEIRLPSASGYDDGQYFTIKDEAGNADEHGITIRTSGSQTIDGELFVTLESPFAALNIYTNGSDKFFIY
jgi:hypothetical protein